MLVVDDEPLIVECIDGWLQREGFDVVATTCLHVALSSIESRAIDAVVSDVEVGPDHARMLLAHLDALGHRAPVVLMSGLPRSRVEMVIGSRSRVVAILEKPFPIEVIIEHLRRALAAPRYLPESPDVLRR